MSEGIPYGYLCSWISEMHCAIGVVYSYSGTEVSVRGCLIAERNKDFITSFAFGGVIDSRCNLKTIARLWQTKT